MSNSLPSPPSPTHFEMAVANVSREDDKKWPQKNKDGRQELEIRLGNEHVSFEVGFTPTYDELTAYFGTDGQDRVPGGRERVGGPRGAEGVLLPGAGPEGAGI